MNQESRLAAFRRLRAIAQTGRAYAQDPYDLERYQELEQIAHELLANLLDSTPEKLNDLYLPEKGYPTPKVDLRAGVFNDDRILLVRERSDGRWSLPGGWADEHEPPGLGIEREVREESGFQVRATRLIAVKDRHLHPYAPGRLERVYKHFFLCELTGGLPATSLETDAVDFFPLDGLPPLSLGRTLPEDIEMLAAFRSQPGRPCYFD